MRAHRAFVAVAVAAVALGAASPPGAGAGESSEVRLQAGLNGHRERPNPADPDGSGFARVTVDTATGTICYELVVRNIAPATAAHIHVGDRRTSGGVVQGLQAPSDGDSSGCVVNAAVAQALADNPAGYYVNVHNGEYPTGAVRGQLAGG